MDVVVVVTGELVMEVMVVDEVEAGPEVSSGWRTRGG